MSQTNKCVISLATKNSRYVDGLARLSNSLRDNASGIDFLGFIHERSVGAPLHTENNYAFKVYAIQKAIDAGYTDILWLDCSVFAVAPIQPLFDIISEQGYWFEGAGCWLSDWCTNAVLDYYKLDQVDEMPMIQSGFMGFNMGDGTGSELFRLFKKACDEGLFNGSWADFRHDQSCISAILYNRGINFSHLPEYVQYAGIYDKQLNDKIILRCQGM